ncbi:MAG: ABC transporter substrate-binding protein [Anaerolineae bacterium]
MKCTRRELLRLSGLAALGVIAAACTPTAVPQAPKATAATGATAAATFAGKIEMYFQSYGPSADMTKSDSNPLPHDMSLRLSKTYMEQHPDVSITLINIPASTGYNEWMTTAQVGGTAPHITWCPVMQRIEGDFGKGWWVPLNAYFEEPNLYIAAGQPGSVKWRDAFYEVPFETKLLPDGNYYCVPFDLVTTFFFYNKDLFKKAGVEVPTSYGDFISAMTTLQKAGTPTSMWTNAGALWFYTNQLGGMIYASKEPKIKKVPGGVVTQQEIACAIKGSLYRGTDPEYKEWLTLSKRYIPLITSDWAAAGVDNNRKFLNQETAILEDGSWRFGLLRANPLVNFEWSTFYAPTLTPQDSPLSIGAGAPPVGGATALQLSITGRAEKEKVVSTCVDILRFYSAPQNAGPMIEEMGQFLPNIKGVDVNADLKGSLKAISEGVGEAGMITYPDKIVEEIRAKIGVEWTNWFTDQIDLATTQKRIDDYMTAYADDAITKYSWSCS